MGSQNYHRNYLNSKNLVTRNRGWRLGLGIILTSLIVLQSPNLKAQAQTPNNPNNATAEDQFKQGNMTIAIQQWTRDIKNNIELPKSLYNRAQAYIILKQYELALADLNQLVTLQGANTQAQVYIVRGIALNELNRLPEAIEDFNKAEKLQPSTLVYTNRGLAYQRSQQLPKALEDLTKSVKLFPSPISKLNLANVQIQLGQYTEAVSAMSQVIEGQQGFFPAYLVRSIAYYNLGKYEEAIRDCLFSLKILPDQPEAFYYAGLSFAKLNRKADASQNLVKAADLYLRQSQPNRYRQVLEKMSELNLQ